jgi:DNA-binding NarL/FixJ family response regulator
MKKNLTIKVLVADDHNLFRSGIIKLLSDHPNIYVLGEAENGPQLIQKYFDLYPDVVLADIAMPQMSGLEAVSLIKEKDQGVKALFLSMYDTDEYIYKVLKSGGMGLINKNIMEGELILAIEQVYNGEKYFRGKWNEHSLEKLFAEFEANTIQPALEKEDQELSYREEQVLRFLNQGFTSQDIAEKMNVSRKSVDYYRSSLMKRYKLKTTADLVRFAVQYFNREKKT